MDMSNKNLKNKKKSDFVDQLTILLNPSLTLVASKYVNY